jgi:hypothetical protein
MFLAGCALWSAEVVDLRKFLMHMNLRNGKEELKPVFYTDGYNFFLTLWNLNYAFDKAQNKA